MIFIDHAQNDYNTLTLFGSYSTKNALRALVYTLLQSSQTRVDYSILFPLVKSVTA